MEQLEFKFDTQLLIDGHDLDEDVIHDYILEHFKGDCLLVVGDDTLIKIHFHTNEPWQILEYGQSIGDIAPAVFFLRQSCSDSTTFTMKMIIQITMEELVRRIFHSFPSVAPYRTMPVSTRF